MAGLFELFGYLFKHLGSLIGISLRSIVYGLTQIVETLSKAFLLFKHRLKGWIANWVSSDIGIITFAIAVIGTTIAIPYIAGVLKNIGITAAVKAAIKAMTDSVGSFLEKLHYSEWLVTHELLIALWDDYKAMISPFYNALGGLSEDLGYSMAVVQLIMLNAKNVVQSTYTLVGADSYIQDLIWYEEASAFMQKIEDRFWRYANDPGQLFRDVDEEIVRPHQEKGSEIMRTLYDTLKDVNDTVNQKADELMTLKTDVDIFVESMPDEIEDRINRRWQPLSEAFDDFYEEQYYPFRDKTSELFGIVDDSIERNEAQIERLRREQNDFLIGLDNLSKLSPGEHDTLVDLMAAIANMSLAKETDNYRNFSGIDDTALSIISAAAAYKPPPIPILALEPPSYASPIPGVPVPRKTWYVGDY